jgi:hypothetical protein
VNVHTKSRLMLETSADTPARRQGAGGSLLGPDASHPLHRAGTHMDDDDDQGAEVLGVEREWEPRWEPQKRTTSRFPERTRTANEDAPEVTD